MDEETSVSLKILFPSSPDYVYVFIYVGEGVVEVSIVF